MKQNVKSFTERSFSLDYFERDGLEKITGISFSNWRYILVKELIDNSLDAVDLKPEKKIECYFSSNMLSLHDSGDGIPEELIDRIYDFTVHVTSKRFRKVSRGYLGNGLKVVIGICCVNGFQLSFVTPNSVKITYVYDREKITPENRIPFEKKSENTNSRPGIYIEGNLTYSLYVTLKELIEEYAIFNPDVTFVLNEDVWPSRVQAKKYTLVHHPQWYDNEAFFSLVTDLAQSAPELTTREFVSMFSPMKSTSVSHKFPKTLSLFFRRANPREVITSFLNYLKTKSKRISTEFLRERAVGEEGAKKMNGFVGYRCSVEVFESKNMTAPFLIEVFAVKKIEETEYGGKDWVVSINNSVTLPGFAFKTSKTIPLKLKGRKDEIYTFESIGFRPKDVADFEGYVLYIHVLSPSIQFLDKGKTHILADGFVQALANTLYALHLTAIKPQLKKTHFKESAKQQSKFSLMKKHAIDGYELASGGGRFKAKARQVYYSVRAIIIREHGITLTEPDYRVFTQEVLTSLFEEKPELEDKIVFEGRGEYFRYLTGEGMPISTQKAEAFIDEIKSKECSINFTGLAYNPTTFYIEHPIELGTANVLFVEKQGFKEVLVDSGILKELAMDLILSQGYSTRAIKTLIRTFQERRINVFILHDCDLDGINIAERIIKGSKTFKTPLNVIDIGLSYKDVVELRKEQDAETYKSRRSYGTILSRLSEEEQKFFCPYPKEREILLEKADYKSKKSKKGQKAKVSSYTYRRVELNALTMPELIDFIRKKIPKPNIVPTREHISMFKESFYTNFRIELLAKDAFFEVAQELFQDQYRSIFSESHNIEALAARIFSDFERSLAQAKEYKDTTWKDELMACIEKHLGEIKEKFKENIRKKLGKVEAFSIDV